MNSRAPCKPNTPDALCETGSWHPPSTTSRTRQLPPQKLGLALHGCRMESWHKMKAMTLLT